MSSDVIGRPMEILLVEDSLVDVRLTIGALAKGQIKHRLTICVDGDEAIEFLGRQGRFARAPRPDLVLLDLFLPKKDGHEVLAAIRADKALHSIPVVIMTASTDPADKAAAEKLQVEAYIEKPMNLDKFLTLVKDLKRFWLNDVLLPAAI